MKKVIIFLDGLCHVCAQEARFLVKTDQTNQIEFVDISNEKFDGSAWGVDKKEVDNNLHVKVMPENKMYVGIDAVIVVWSVIPSWSILAKILSLPGIHFLSSLAYYVFTRIRKCLPKRRTSIMREVQKK